ATTQSCSLTSSPCSRASSRSYSLPPSSSWRSEDFSFSAFLALFLPLVAAMLSSRLCLHHARVCVLKTEGLNHGPKALGSPSGRVSSGAMLRDKISGPLLINQVAM